MDSNLGIRKKYSSTITKIIELVKSRADFLLYMFVKLSSQFMSLITNILIISKLTTYEYGAYSLVLMVIGFTTTFGFEWSASSIIYFGSKENANTGALRKTFWSWAVISATSGMLVISLIIFFRTSIKLYLGGDYIYFIIFIVMVRVLRKILVNYLLTTNRRKQSAYLFFVSNLLLLILVFTFNLTIEKILILLTISEMSSLVFALMVDKNHIGKPIFDMGNLKKILAFTLWQLFGFSGVYIINFGDNAVIKYFLTVSDVGVYNSAYKLFNSIAMLSYVLTSYFASKISVDIAKQNKAKIKQFFYRERVAILFIVFIGHLVVGINAKFIIGVIYNASYKEAGFVLSILMIGSFFRYIESFNVIFYNSSGNHKVLQFTNIVQAILNIVLDIFFVSIFGIVGAAIATSVALSSKAIFSLIFCERKIRKMIT